MHLDVKGMVQPCVVAVAHCAGRFPNKHKSDWFQFVTLLISGTLLFEVSYIPKLTQKIFIVDVCRNIKSASAEGIRLEIFDMVSEDHLLPWVLWLLVYKNVCSFTRHVKIEGNVIMQWKVVVCSQNDGQVCFILRGNNFFVRAVFPHAVSVYMYRMLTVNNNRLVISLFCY